MAAQQLAGAGFKEVVNLKGGIKGWNGIEAVGGEEQGLELFTDLDSAEDILKTAYSLEEGLQDFYRKTMEKVDGAASELFDKLADVEDKHKDRIFEEYSRLTGESDRDAFVRGLEGSYVEGGLTTEEYLERFSPDLNRQQDIISLAMSIEAQALDLYTRSARRTDDSEGRKVLEQIASEERAHLERLGDLMDSLLEADNG